MWHASVANQEFLDRSTPLGKLQSRSPINLVSLKCRRGLPRRRIAMSQTRAHSKDRVCNGIVLKRQSFSEMPPYPSHLPPYFLIGLQLLCNSSESFEKWKRQSKARYKKETSTKLRAKLNWDIQWQNINRVISNLTSSFLLGVKIVFNAIQNPVEAINAINQQIKANQS